MSDKEVKAAARFEMLWDCAFCGKTKLLGITHRHCPECGAAQDPTKRYFPSDAEKVAVKDDYAGADRICESCKHPNGAKATFCAGCGAPLAEAGAAKVRSDRVAPAGRAFAADTAKAAEAELGAGAKAPLRAKKSSRWWIYTLVIVAALVVAIYMLCIRKKSGSFEVTAQTWERRIEIEEYVEKSGANWRDSLPAGAELGFCSDKEFAKAVPEDCHTRQVDQGDGTYKEQTECAPAKSAVIKPWCSYTVRSWEVQDQLAARTTGDAGDARTWPTSPYPTQVTQRLGARREKRRVELLKVELKGTGGTHSCEVGEALWTELTPGTKAKGSVRGVSDAIDCDDLRVE
jgi:hypothetical protein